MRSLQDFRLHQINVYETEYLYKEIFEDETYLKHGIAIPEGAVVFDIGANIGLFTLFVKHRAAIDRVTFWGLNDRRSWRRGQNPLVFDAENQPKPALQAIIDAVIKAKA